MRALSTLFFLFLINNIAYSQKPFEYKWWNPESSHYAVIEGQGWLGENEYFYGRFPGRAKSQVREVLWMKSEQTAGLVARFSTNAPSISVRYQVEGTTAFEHMPATGVSGVDLYALDKKKGWEWPGFTYLFNDTIQYFFDSLRTGGQKEFYLYLPLYVKLKWLEIGIPAGFEFNPLPARKEKPIVIYGTSIVQGGCASRPGMAWTSILGRKLKQPVINLGFSSNGLLETPVISLLCELDAGVYVLDCLPNLIAYPPGEISRRIKDAVIKIRKERPTTPIILAEHGDANINLLDKHLHQQFLKVNQVAAETYRDLVKSGIKNLHYLSAAEINIDIDGTVDGQHPNDLGMSLYARAYYQKIKTILKK